MNTELKLPRENATFLGSTLNLGESLKKVILLELDESRTIDQTINNPLKAIITDEIGTSIASDLCKIEFYD